MKEIIIDGNNFDSLDKFYNEIEKKLTNGLDWRIGRNLDAYNDILRGGFGIHDYEEPIKIKWINSGLSKKNLGQALFDVIVQITRAHEHIQLCVE